MKNLYQVIINSIIVTTLLLIEKISLQNWMNDMLGKYK